jgi:hypothetical protein
MARPRSNRIKINTGEITMTEDQKTKMKAQMFGTVALPQKVLVDSPLKMPSMDLLQRPFRDARAVSYLSCTNCDLFTEIGRDMLDRLLDVVNEYADGPVWDDSRRAEFNGKEKFILASGCPRCCAPVVVTVVDIPGCCLVDHHSLV